MSTLTLEKTLKRFRTLLCSLVASQQNFYVGELRDAANCHRGYLIFRSTRQNTTPVVVLCSVIDGKVMVRATYFVKVGTSKEHNAQASEALIAELQDAFTRAITYP